MAAAQSYGNPNLLLTVLHWIPTIVVIFAIEKLAARAWVLRSLLSNRVIAPRQGVYLVAGWSLLAALLFALILAIIPAGLAQPKYVALGVFLALPFARLGAASLMLERNRHR